MGSLSDPNNMGATPVGDQRSYGARRTGQGRWATLDGLGILWTDDNDALQLSRLDNADQSAAYQLRLELIAASQTGATATATFDATIAERGQPTVHNGDLETL